MASWACKAVRSLTLLTFSSWYMIAFWVSVLVIPFSPNKANRRPRWVSVIGVLAACSLVILFTWGVGAAGGVVGVLGCGLLPSAGRPLATLPSSSSSAVMPTTAPIA